MYLMHKSKREALGSQAPCFHLQLSDLRLPVKVLGSQGATISPPWLFLPDYRNFWIAAMNLVT